MFGFLLDIASAIISVIIPIYRTWKVLKSRKTTQLVPLAKYWTVFGLTTIIDMLAAALYFPYIIPGYSVLKLITNIYISCSGYSYIYDQVVSKFLCDNEPAATRILADAGRYSGRLVGNLLQEAVHYTLLTVSANNDVNYASARGITAQSCISDRSIEVQDECEIVYPEEIKPEVNNLVPLPESSNSEWDMDDAGDQNNEVVVSKPAKRHSSRVRKSKK